MVREMTYDEAVIAMVDANIQRENVLPSEKAFAYKMKIDALSRQGYRSDFDSAPEWAASWPTHARATLWRNNRGRARAKYSATSASRTSTPICSTWWTAGRWPCAPPWRSAICPKGSRTTCSTPWGWRRARRPTPQAIRMRRLFGAGRAVARSHGVHHGRAQTQPGGTVPHPPREDRAFLQARHEQGGRGGPHSQGARAS